MPYRLKDRNRQIPQGLKFLQPETKWQPYPYSSFKTIVDGLLQHRRANPFLAKKHNWSMDWNVVAEEVDSYNSKLCETHGWMDFIVERGGGPAGPKSTARPQPGMLQSLRNVAAGPKLLSEWLGNGGVPVDNNLAESRAKVCTNCPQNQKGDWTSFFTVPTAAFIRAQLSMRQDMALATSSDERLGVCVACGCPLKLKVHVPASHIKKYTSEAVRKALDPQCWIPPEIDAQ